MQQIKNTITLLTLLFSTINLLAQHEGIIAHDPAIAQENDKYYLFTTGWGIDMWQSDNMVSWERAGHVFNQPPEWTKETVEGFKGHMWAPDIVFHNNQYFLYYSISAFGKNTSAIGVATNQTLDPQNENYQWIDHGMLIQSIPNQTNWNAIDPAVAFDKKNKPYMFFGSFWDGLKRVKLTDELLEIDEDINKIQTVASRKKSSKEPNPPAIEDNPRDAGGNAIEAPFVFKKGKYYYLFASIDYCCKGPRSSYKIIVARSKKIKGKFTDDNGKDMAINGGKLVLQGNENWHGVGHNAVASFNGNDYLIFHGYDANDDGKPKLIIRQIQWTNDLWPSVQL
ncbi:MAG: family 43 glycosylhydrolase [Mangrovibacterium sp.]